MRLLASTDIALRILIRLGQGAAGHHLSVERLAADLGGLSRNHLHKIVQDLTALGITRTVRGAGGGVMLAVPPASIQIGTLVRMLEANQPLVECYRADGGACSLMPTCRLRSMLRHALDSFYHRLDAQTLADCI